MSWLHAKRKAELIALYEAEQRRNATDRRSSQEYYARQLAARDTRIEALERQLLPGTQDALESIRDSLADLREYFRDTARTVENLPYLHPDREDHKQAWDTVEDGLAAIVEILDGRPRPAAHPLPSNSEDSWLTT